MAITLDTSQGHCNSADPSSSVAGSVITLVPRTTIYEGNGPNSQTPAIKASGVNGLTPQFKFSDAALIHPWNANETGFFSYDGLSWFPAQLVSHTGGIVTCQPTAPFAQNDVWFAREMLEGYDVITDWLTNTVAHLPYIQQLQGGSNFIVDTYSTQTDELGRTVASYPLYGFKIQTGRIGKKTAGLISGVHAGECWATTCFRKAIEWLCGGDAEAIALRNAFNWVILPLVNAPGRDGGHCRAQFQVTAGTNNDLNRHFSDTTNLFETVTKPRTVLTRELSFGECGIFMDWHVLDGNHTSSDPPGGYYTGQGSALDAFWQPAINARLGVALITSIPVGATTYWAVNGTTTGAPVAQLSEVHEFNDSYTKNLTVAADFGQKSMLALYDILAAGHFTGITAQTPVGSPFARRVA